MKTHSALILLLAVILFLTGCGGPEILTGTNSADESTGGENSGGIAAVTVIDPSQMFTDRDRDPSYDSGKSAHIQLSGSGAASSSNAVKISGTTVTITDEGVYILTGTLDDGMVIVNADKEDKVQLVLSGVTILSQTSAPIFVQQADKVFLTLAEGTENTLTNGGSFAVMDGTNLDGVIFSKEDLTVNGSGSLNITSPAGHGIVCKDDLAVTGGTLLVSCASHGIAGKDSVRMAAADVTIAAGKDGIHAENDEDATLGYAYIESGSYTIHAEGDGISAANVLQIQNGTFDLITGGGSVNGSQNTSDNWGSMGGPGGMGGGRPGGMGGGFGGMGGSGGQINESEDSASIKGIKAGADLVINGGSFIIDSADDAVHSNAGLTVNNGSFVISTGDDGFHADETLMLFGGTVNISESYEGLEGLCIDISGGNIRIVSTDDGLNAAGGMDQSGFGDNRGDRFGPGTGGSSDSYINISGGTIYMNASGDGIDANGSLTISGGHVTVCGPTQGDTAVLDYDISASITGGTFIGTGSQMMAQTFSQSEQGVFAVSVGNQAAGTPITLKDSKGNTLVCYEPALSYAIVILSTPEMVKGENYTITVGELSGEFAAS